MLPTLKPGDLVLVDVRAFRLRDPAPDEIIVARHPRQEGLTLINRVGFVDEAGRVFLRSDNPREGSDSRQFGAVAPDAILGRVTARVQP